MSKTSNNTVQEKLTQLSNLVEWFQGDDFTLEAAVEKAQGINDTVKQAESYRDKVFTAMQALRGDIDSLEMIVPRDTWPVPTYVDLLFKL